MRKALIAAISVTVLAAAFLSLLWFGNRNDVQPPLPTHIGTARMELDGSITLHLSTGSATLRGEAVLTYAKGDANYTRVLNHINAGLPAGKQLLPGGSEELVKPWPVQSGGKTIDQTSLVVTARSSGLVPLIQTTTVEQSGHVSQQFAAEVQAVVDGMPLKIRVLVKNSGIRIIAAAAVTDALPQLRGQQPRGWPPGSTWDNVDGVFYNGSIVVVAEYTWKNGRRVSAGDAEGVTRHEYGHAVDAALGYFSSSVAFLTAYKSDSAKIPASARGNLQYFLQSGLGGPQETFAEVFAAMNGGNSRWHLVGYIPQHFPETKGAVQDKLDNLP